MNTLARPGAKRKPGAIFHNHSRVRGGYAVRYALLDFTADRCYAVARAPQAQGGNHDDTRRLHGTSRAHLFRRGPGAGPFRGRLPRELLPHRRAGAAGGTGSPARRAGPVHRVRRLHSRRAVLPLPQAPAGGKTRRGHCPPGLSGPCGRRGETLPGGRAHQRAHAHLPGPAQEPAHVPARLLAQRPHRRTVRQRVLPGRAARRGPGHDPHARPARPPGGLGRERPLPPHARQRRTPRQGARAAHQRHSAQRRPQLALRGLDHGRAAAGGPGRLLRGQELPPLPPRLLRQHRDPEGHGARAGSGRLGLRAGRVPAAGPLGALRRGRARGARGRRGLRQPGRPGAAGPPMHRAHRQRRLGPDGRRGRARAEPVLGGAPVQQHPHGPHPRRAAHGSARRAHPARHPAPPAPRPARAARSLDRRPGQPRPRARHRRARPGSRPARSRCPRRRAGPSVPPAHGPGLLQ